MWIFEFFTGSIYNNLMRMCCVFEGDPGDGGGGFDVASLSALEGDSFRAILPEDMRTKPYMKDVNSFGDFTKKFDGAQSLIGKSAIPAPDASDEVWNEFHKKIGLPETADGYDIGEVEGVPKDYIDKASEVGLMKKIMHEAGISGRQGKVFASRMLKSFYEAEAAEKTEGDAKFNSFMDETFGQHKAAMLENGKKFLATTLPDTVKPFLEDLDDKGLAVVIATADAMVRKYVSEDGFRGKGDPAPGSGKDTEDSIQAEMRTIHANPAYSDPFKDRTVHAELAAKMENCRARLRKLRFNT